MYSARTTGSRQAYEVRGRWEKGELGWHELGGLEPGSLLPICTLHHDLAGVIQALDAAIILMRGHLQEGTEWPSCSQTCFPAWGGKHLAMCLANLHSDAHRQPSCWALWGFLLVLLGRMGALGSEAFRESLLWRLSCPCGVSLHMHSSWGEAAAPSRVHVSLLSPASAAPLVFLGESRSCSHMKSGGRSLAAAAAVARGRLWASDWHCSG